MHGQMWKQRHDFDKKKKNLEIWINSLPSSHQSHADKVSHAQ